MLRPLPIHVSEQRLVLGGRLSDDGPHHQVRSVQRRAAASTWSGQQHAVSAAGWALRSWTQLRSSAKQLQQRNQGVIRVNEFVGRHKKQQKKVRACRCSLLLWPPTCALQAQPSNPIKPDLGGYMPNRGTGGAAAFHLHLIWGAVINTHTGEFEFPYNDQAEVHVAAVKFR